MRSFSPGRYGDSKYLRMPSAPSGSMRHDSSIQNSSSSHTCPSPTASCACHVRSKCFPCFSSATRSTGWRKPIQRAACVSWLMRSWRSEACPIGST